MKKLLVSALCLLLTALSALSLTGCSLNSGTVYDDLRLGKYIDIPKYKVVLYQSEIDENLKYQIEGFLEETKKTELIDDRGVQKGDRVTVDTCLYVYTHTSSGTDERTPFDEYAKVDEKEKTSLTNFVIDDFGDGSLFKEIETALLGAETGDTVTTSVTYEDKESVKPAQLRGQTVEIDVTVKKIEAVSIPEYNDLLVETTTIYKTVAEFEEALLVELKRAMVWSTFVEGCKIKAYPADRIELYQKEYTDYYKYMAESNGMTEADYVAAILGYNTEEYADAAMDYAKNTVAEELALYTVAKKRGIKVSDKEYQAYCESLLEDYDCETVAELEENYGGSEMFRRAVYWDKVKDFLISKMVISNEMPPDGGNDAEGENADAAQE